ncbi:hypothetical protein [Pseudomonas sp. PA-1-3F]|uniref:hypothetical protein n=1 Tax=Pseudomonas sp. PA-1-3F TaxID=2665465 RepID=UPI001F44F8F4|nr:hypothetical protein [Pseudomonas sp. PA-1-3F]MCF5686835.1 hypothetical protein [Pseudomonas sp. PA-1-3F]
MGHSLVPFHLPWGVPDRIKDGSDKTVKDTLLNVEILYAHWQASLIWHCLMRYGPVVTKLISVEGRYGFLRKRDMDGDIRALAETPKNREQVILNDAKASSRGVFGVPSFFIGDELFLVMTA